MEESGFFVRLHGKLFPQCCSWLSYYNTRPFECHAMPRENQDVLVPYVYFSVGTCQRDGELGGSVVPHIYLSSIYLLVFISILRLHTTLLMEAIQQYTCCTVNTIESRRVDDTIPYACAPLPCSAGTQLSYTLTRHSSSMHHLVAPLFSNLDHDHPNITYSTTLYGIVPEH